MEKKELQNLIKMLQSPDKENRILAYNILETRVSDKWIALLCYKFGIGDESEWLTEAPKTYTLLGSFQSMLAITEGNFFAKIFFLCTRPTTSPMITEVFFEEYGNYLTRLCGSESPVTSINITVNFKPNAADAC